MLTKFGTWIVYQIWCKDSCNKFGTNFKNTLTYSSCLQSPIWVHHFCTKFGTLYLYPNFVHYTYTKFGKKIYTPLIFLILIRILRPCHRLLPSPGAVSVLDSDNMNEEESLLASSLSASCLLVAKALIFLSSFMKRI